MSSILAFSIILTENFEKVDLILVVKVAIKLQLRNSEFRQLRTRPQKT